MHRILIALLTALLPTTTGCASPGATEPAGKPTPVTSEPWFEAVISVRNLDQTGAFFTEVGGYELRWEGDASGSELAFYDLPEAASARVRVLGVPGVAQPTIRFLQFENAGPSQPMRPGAHAWDTGCYFSLMLRMKDIQGIYEEALDLGWLTETPIAPLEFGASKLRIVIFKGPHGVQVQGYERLSPPLPEAFPAFERMSPPFNIMQMARDRDATYAFTTEVLGFTTFHHGKPYTSQTEKPMPLGIPINITDTSRYRASIVAPAAGEMGRLEMIELMDLKGFDHRDRCAAPNLGLLAVRYPVTSAADTARTLQLRGGELSQKTIAVDLGNGRSGHALAIDSPDGARIEFVELQP